MKVHEAIIKMTELDKWVDEAKMCWTQPGVDMLSHLK